MTDNMCAVCSPLIGISLDHLAGISSMCRALADDCFAPNVCCRCSTTSGISNMPELALEHRQVSTSTTATQDLATGAPPLIWAVLTRLSARVRRLQKLPGA